MMNETQEKRVYERGKRLYIDFVKRGKRVRLATGLKANAENRRFVLKHFAEFAVGKKDDLLKNHKDFTSAEFDKYLPKSEKARTAFAKRGEEIFFIKNILDEMQIEKCEFRKESTQKGFKNKAAALMKFCDESGIYDIREVEREFCKGYFKFLLAQNYTKGTIDGYFNVLFELLKFAFDDKELIDKNPYYKPKFSAGEFKESKELRAFTLNEAQSLIKTAQGELKSYLIIAFFTGMRVGELLGLEFADLDFSKDIIKVQRTLLPSGRTNAPKTKNSRREVLMLEPVKNELTRLNAAAKDKQSRIFARSRNFYVTRFKALLQSLNFDESWTLYETRHSFASIMLQRGEEMAWVSKTMGHKDLSITLQRYTAFLPDKSIKRGEFLRGLDFNAEPSLFNVG